MMHETSPLKDSAAHLQSAADALSKKLLTIITGSELHPNVLHFHRKEIANEKALRTVCLGLVDVAKEYQYSSYDTGNESVIAIDPQRRDAKFMRLATEFSDKSKDMASSLAGDINKIAEAIVSLKSTLAEQGTEFPKTDKIRVNGCSSSRA